MKILAIIPLFAFSFFAAQKLPMSIFPKVKTDSIKIKSFDVEDLKKLDLGNNDISKYKILVKKPENSDLYYTQNYFPITKTIEMPNNLSIAKNTNKKEIEIKNQK